METTTTSQRIIALVKPEYLERVPKQVMEHAIQMSCRLIKDQHKELYQAFEEEKLSDEVKEEMTNLINAIFEDNLAKQGL
ncbi:hypothetical protein [Streptococcus sp. zg-JUN1979]|uniref:hypothetical protein n=1 Tax=Streptococcus sp. zg-JUN1979 TaxID=3391450 RepID=UPI0039A6D234